MVGLGGLQTVARKVLEDGVTAFCPTIITSSNEVYKSLVPQHTPSQGGQHGCTVLGLHLEGPFINPAKNGCHPIESVRELTPSHSLGSAICSRLSLSSVWAGVAVRNICGSNAHGWPVALLL